MDDWPRPNFKFSEAALERNPPDMEVVVAMHDGGFIIHRRIGGTWLSPETIPGWDHPAQPPPTG